MILHRVVNFNKRNPAPRNFNRGFHDDQWCGDPRAHRNSEEYYGEGNYPSNDVQYFDDSSSSFHRNPPPSRNVRQACYAWLNEPRAASTGWLTVELVERGCLMIICGCGFFFSGQFILPPRLWQTWSEASAQLEVVKLIDVLLVSDCQLLHCPLGGGRVLSLKKVNTITLMEI